MKKRFYAAIIRLLDRLIAALEKPVFPGASYMAILFLTAIVAIAKGNSILAAVNVTGYFVIAAMRMIAKHVISELKP